MKLAVRKDGGELHGAGGYHYMLHPMKLTDDDAGFFGLIGYVIIEVEESLGLELIRDARAALHHQCNVGLITEKAIKRKQISPEEG